MGADWTIVFEDTAALRVVVNVVSSVMPRVFFKVKTESDGKKVLMVDSADAAMMCCLSARIQLDNVVVRHEDEFSFCIDCKKLSLALDDPSCQHLALTMEGNQADAKVYLKMHDPDQPSHEQSITLPTYVDSDNNIDAIPAMDFDMMLEVDLNALREMMKKAIKVHTEHLRIRVHLLDKGARKVSVVTFSIEGDDFYCEERFCHETTRDEDNSMIVRAVADGTVAMPDDADTPQYEGVFPVEKIHAFAKNVQARMLTAKVKTDMPIMFTQSLSGSSDDTSYVRFLVAPVREDDA
jgi:hypothetical protein